MSEKAYRVLLYYKYVDIAEPEQFVQDHKALCKKLNLKGRILIGSEGINGTLAGRTEDTDEYKRIMGEDERFADIHWKEDAYDSIPFPKLKVKYREEIVTLGLPGEAPSSRGGEHLSPEEWHKMAADENAVILDARNDYEWEIGKFKDAILPDVKTFREFPQWVKDHKEELEGKKVLMYCTGGIRCERASTVLKDEGLDDVYQLSGGIVTYGKEIPDGLWEGSCFVFDERMAVQVNDDEHHDVISTCHHCETATDVYYNCCNAQCNKLILLCEECKELSNMACSEDCSTKHRAGVVKRWNIKTRTAEVPVQEIA